MAIFFFSMTSGFENPELSALTRVSRTLFTSLHSVWRCAARRRRQDWGQGGAGSEGDEPSRRREAARGQEAAL